MTELKEDIKDIKKMLKPKDDRKEKKFKLPRYSIPNRVQLRKNYVTVMKINENSQVSFSKIPITEQTVLVDEIPRLAAAGYVVYFNKNPMIILPSWSVEPFSPMEHYNDSLLNGSNSKGFKLLMNRMKLAALETKKQIPGMLKWILGAGLAGIIGYALITGGG